MRKGASLLAVVVLSGACAHKVRSGYYVPPRSEARIEKRLALVAPPDYPRAFELKGGRIVAGQAYLDAVEGMLGALFTSVRRVPSADAAAGVDYIVRVGTDVFNGHSLLFEDAGSRVPAGWFESTFQRIEHPPTDEPAKYAAEFFEQSSSATLDDIARRILLSEWLRLGKDEVARLDALMSKSHEKAREGDHAGAFDAALAVFRAALPGSPRRSDAREDALRAASQLPPSDARRERLKELGGER